MYQLDMSCCYVDISVRIDSPEIYLEKLLCNLLVPVHGMMVVGHDIERVDHDGLDCHYMSLAFENCSFTMIKLSYILSPSVIWPLRATIKRLMAS